MQAKGIKIIPTVSWGEPNTFWFCFDGIPKGSIVAVSTIGVRKEKSLFMQGYEEMMRKIKPKAVICYGKPFEEMKGKIITVDYAQTNNYKKHYTLQPDERMISKNIFGIRNKRAFGYVDVEKGRGSAGGGNIFLPKNDSQLKHIFAERDGHVPDTPQNRKKLIELAKDQSKYLGKDKHGNSWHAEITGDGKQWWVRFREQTINEGGLNQYPRPWDPESGLNKNPFK